MGTEVFREVAIERAPKQQVMIDAYTEEAPIIANLTMSPSSHPFANVYERVLTVNGGEVVNVDDTLPAVGMDTELVQKDLSVIGGIIEVGEEKAKAFGGVDSYFQKKLPTIIRETGSNAEYSLIYDNLRQFAINNNKAYSASGAANKNYTIIALKQTVGENCGIYSQQMFGDGKVFDTMALNNGGLYKLTGGELGYGMRIKNYFGMQLANPRNIAAIVNVDLVNDKVPTEKTVDTMLADARADAANTVLLMHPKVFAYVFKNFKATATQYMANDMNIAIPYTHYAGLRIITSWNFLDGSEADVAL